MRSGALWCFDVRSVVWRRNDGSHSIGASRSPVRWGRCLQRRKYQSIFCERPRGRGLSRSGHFAKAFTVMRTVRAL